MVKQRVASTSREEAEIGTMRSRAASDAENEKFPIYQPDDDDSHEYDSYSEPSSPTFSQQPRPPMYQRAFSARHRSSHLVRVPNSIMRYFCLGVAVMLLLFMYSLFHMSQHTEVELQQARKENPFATIAMFESFPFLNRYYGGIRELIPWGENIPEYPTLEDGTTGLNVTDEEKRWEPKSRRASSRKRSIQPSIEFNPYPNYTTAAYMDNYGRKVDCFLDAANTIRVPPVRVYEGVPRGYPDPVIGGADLIGIRNDICYDRFGRLGPYGLGYSVAQGGSGAQTQGEREGSEMVWQDYPKVDYREIDWADVQGRCLASNKHRFRVVSEEKYNVFSTMPAAIPVNTKRQESPASDPPPEKTKLPRSAFLIRTWWDYNYTPEDILYLRSLISELHVNTGGEYTVHFLVHVRDNDVPIWSDKETYDRILRKSLPREFQGMATLWSERQMFLLYPGLEENHSRDMLVYGVFRSSFMPVQYFAYMHPEYDYFWNWEMDTRSTHHWYHFFETAIKWAKEQPRKYLWERSGRYYVPAEHGTWEDFSQMTRIQTEHGTNSANNMWSALGVGGARIKGDKAVWGPERPIDDDVAFPDDPKPPTSMDRDKFSWGVGEEADLIVFNPLFDPDGTTWLLTDDTTGYDKKHGQPPRRTAIIAASRLSRKLLTMMHRETAVKRHTMFSEMWPASCALHHGLKAVYVPHPMYVDRKWPTKYLENVFNAGRNGATGGARTSVFGDREHNFRGMTWYYNAGFPEVLWNRFLGLKFHNNGGAEEELARTGRFCMPGMLLHPIKRIELPVEGRTQADIKKEQAERAPRPWDPVADRPLDPKA